VIGTDGFGADTHILGRPGHARRLRALKRLHGGGLWVKPDLLDLGAHVPEVVTSKWPDTSAAVRAYGHVIYAAVAVNDNGAADVVSDLLDLFFDEQRGLGEAVRDAHRADLHQALAYASLANVERVDTILAYPHIAEDAAAPPVALATVASGRRRVRLILAGLPFGFRSPGLREQVLEAWRGWLAA
jgi:hypothetical protein